ncbi:hypothetical protein ARMGADRAFT_1034980 [Armillaria gallica]|uniref:Uncharacterized protein n=1 Tax=Armillaria gallica TaxID=47427 RepID=A0A2H3D6P5_ARMGA|nr:hypothetical protein ARMGADRAFT_1034980 [Armillaria gallica]
MSSPFKPLLILICDFKLTLELDPMFKNKLLVKYNAYVAHYGVIGFYKLDVNKQAGGAEDMEIFAIDAHIFVFKHSEKIWKIIGADPRALMVCTPQWQRAFKPVKTAIITYTVFLTALCSVAGSKLEMKNVKEDRIPIVSGEKMVYFSSIHSQRASGSNTG